MARRSRGSSDRRQQGQLAKSSESSDVAVSAGSPRIAVAEEKERDASGTNGRNRINSKGGGGFVAEVINKRLRNLRKKLQRAESSEKKKTAGGQISSEQEALVASIPELRAIVKELEEIAEADLRDKADGGKGIATVGGDGSVGGAQPAEGVTEEAITSAEERGRAEAVQRENMVHHQTLRLLYAVSDKMSQTLEKCATSVERAQLTGFYHLVLSSVDFGAAIDEKFPQPPLVAIKHLRQLAEYSTRPIDKPQNTLKPDAEAMGDICYADVSKIIDKVIAAAGLKNGQLLSESKDCTGVKMPKLAETMFIRSEEAGSDDSENDFNLQIEVPPGGFNFLATADVLEDSEAAAKEPATPTESQPSMDMPAPVHHAQESSLGDGQQEAGGANDRVGGFVQPLKNPLASEEPATAASGRAESDSSATLAERSMAMPIAAENAAADAIDASALPAGFAPYLASSQVASMAGWPAASVPSTTEATSGGLVPGIYGGVVPMPFPPHIAMQYGYVPPQMYGMQPMSHIASIGSPGIGDGGDVSNPPSGAAAAKDPSSLPCAMDQQAHPSHQGIGANLIQPIAVAPGIAGNPLAEDMWNSANTVAGHHHSGEQVPQIGTPTPMAAASGHQGMSATPPLAGSYQHPAMAAAAAAAAAAAGYPMAAPFMYPHADASNLSTAATGGGSENNDSVNSADSASSNRGGVAGGVSSRPNTMYYPQLTPDGQRGFVQAMGMGMGMGMGVGMGMGMAEYPQTAPYVWPQQAAPHHPNHHHQHLQSYAKDMQTAMYSGYPYQSQAGSQQSSAQQPQQQQAQPPPQAQPQQSHGYRRRGSGSNSNNSSNNGGAGSSHHGQYTRDRRGHNGNGGYQRQQRWHSNNSNNNNNSGGNSHHRQHNHYNQQQSHSSSFGHNRQNQSQQSQENSSSYGGSGVSGNDGSSVGGASNQGYYSRQQ